MSRKESGLPVIADWSELRGVEPLPPRIVWARDGKEMVLIPPGAFTMGVEEEEARQLASKWDYPESYLLASAPLREVVLGAYYIDVTPVTHDEYAQFVAASPDHAVPYVDEPWAQPYNWNRQQRQPADAVAQHPVVVVSWKEAQAYAAWAGKSLPSEAQWEKAARGTDVRTFPWGDEWDETRLNSAENKTNSALRSYPQWREWWEKLDKSKEAGTTPVGAYPSGASPYGALDIAGNVFEMCSDAYLAYPGSQIEHPAFDENRRALRGGSWDFIEFGQRTFFRFFIDLPARLNFVGFRCATVPF